MILQEAVKLMDFKGQTTIQTCGIMVKFFIQNKTLQRSGTKTKNRAVSLSFIQIAKLA